jgi:PAS domain S-box-containing protein
MEYLTVGQNLQIIETSLGVQRFADRPHVATPGKHVCLGFPELIGVEDILVAILRGRQASFELKGVSRCSEKGSSLYIDIYVIKATNSENLKEHRLIIFIEDVTERMVLEQKLVQRSNEVSLLLEAWGSSNEYLNRIIQSLADILLVTTQSGLIKMINQATKRLFEYSEEELIGRQISSIIQDYNALLEAGQYYLRSQEVIQDLAVFGLTKQGKKVAIAFSCSAIKTQIDSLPDFIYVGREITRR